MTVVLVVVVVVVVAAAVAAAVTVACFCFFFIVAVLSFVKTRRPTKLASARRHKCQDRLSRWGGGRYSRDGTEKGIMLALLRLCQTSRAMITGAAPVSPDHDKAAATFGLTIQ